MLCQSVITIIYEGIEAGEGGKRGLAVLGNRENVTGPTDWGVLVWGEQIVEVETLEKGSWKTTSGDERVRCCGAKIQWCLVIAVTKFSV